MQRPRGFGLSDLGYASLHRRETVAVRGKTLAGETERLGIPIEPDHPAHAGVEERRGMATGAHGHVRDQR